METVIFDQDIKVFYVTATSFPEGIMDAFQALYKLVPFSTNRKFFGISRPENDGPIVYRAAVEEIREAEAEKFNCDTLILPKGKYACLTINNYKEDIPAISKAFDTLLAQPGLDPQGYCVEWYFNDTDVKCMVTLAQ